MGGFNVCDKCECAKAQDEVHALFYCNCFEVCELGRKYKDLFIDLSKQSHTSARLPNTDFIPFLVSFHIITDPEINAFLDQASSADQPDSRAVSQLPCNPCDRIPISIEEKRIPRLRHRTSPPPRKQDKSMGTRRVTSSTLCLTLATDHLVGAYTLGPSFIPDTA
eukprot:896519-Pelagomonas_calceolata.AAC.6